MPVAGGDLLAAGLVALVACREEVAAPGALPPISERCRVRAEPVVLRWWSVDVDTLLLVGAFYRATVVASGLMSERKRGVAMTDPELTALRRRAEDGDRDAADELVELASERGDLDELRRMADTGNTTASDQLIELASERGDLDELRRMADGGNATATDQLVELATEREDLDELRRLAESGNANAAAQLEELAAE